MKTAWKDPKTNIGGVARGEYYYPRTSIIEEIWRVLEKGNSVLIAAPRRVGKTSIMQYLNENPKDEYETVFSNIQGIDSADELYRRIFDLIFSRLKRRKKIFKQIMIYLKTRNITEVDIKGKIKMEKAAIDFEMELGKLIHEIDTSKKIKIILLLDELPEVLFRLHKAGKTDEAISVLKNMREWRQNSRNRNILFVFAGSVGIHYVTNIIDRRSAVLNDLSEIDCPPLEKDEFPAYIQWATDKSTVQYSEDLIHYLAGKIQYFVPYFINLMLDEINITARKSNQPSINRSIIDTSFEKISQGNQYFSDWEARLRDYMQESDYAFCNELLTYLAHKEDLTLEIIYDKAVKHGITDSYMSQIDNLKKDGYIAEKDGRFSFVSPFLKAYWKHANPVYHG
ncbi:MAG: ATP-binding protein [Bacteroidales bacterium]|jgi:hypothetical protein|nr:ATP-binding protein [Bacteroidales bacterium]